MELCQSFLVVKRDFDYVSKVVKSMKWQRQRNVSGIIFSYNFLIHSSYENPSFKIPITLKRTAEFSTRKFWKSKLFCLESWEQSLQTERKAFFVCLHRYLVMHLEVEKSSWIFHREEKLCEFIKLIRRNVCLFICSVALNWKISEIFRRAKHFSRTKI